MTEEQGGMTEEQGGIAKERGGIAKERGGIAKEQGGMTEERGGIAKERGGITEGYNSQSSTSFLLRPPPSLLRPQNSDLVGLGSDQSEGREAEIAALGGAVGEQF
jgi:hypothetical protein